MRALSQPKEFTTMLTTTLRTTTALLLLGLATACTAGQEEVDADPAALEQADEPIDELASPEERAGAELPAAEFEARVDLDERRATEALRAESCRLDLEPGDALAQAPIIRAPGVADPRYRVEEDPIQASIAAQERREREDAELELSASVDADTIAAQQRYLEQVAAAPELDAEARAELKARELGER